MAGKFFSILIKALLFRNTSKKLIFKSMNLQTIIEIIEFISKETETQKIIEKYENLLAVLNKIKNKPDINFSTELAKAREELTRALSATEPVNQPYPGSNVLHDIDKENVVGLQAVHRIDSIFESNQADTEEISVELNKRIIATNALLSSGFEALKFLNIFSVPDSTLSEKALLTLHFEGKTSMQTINDLERYTRIWIGIINDFALLTISSECQPVIEMIDKRSMILSIPEGDKILYAIFSGTKKVIETYSKILRIRRLQLEVQKLSLNNGIGEQLDNEISATINEISEIVVTELMEMHQLHPENGNDELFIRVKKSFKLILDFIEKGGKIECKLSRNNENIDDCNNMLLSAYQLVSEIEETVREMNGLRLSQVEAPVPGQN
jgi:hypothetical protein